MGVASHVERGICWNAKQHTLLIMAYQYFITNAMQLFCYAILVDFCKLFHLLIRCSFL